MAETAVLILSDGQWVGDVSTLETGRDGLSRQTSKSHRYDNGRRPRVDR
jgi:hypothetical protein